MTHDLLRINDKVTALNNAVIDHLQPRQCKFGGTRLLLVAGPLGASRVYGTS